MQLVDAMIRGALPQVSQMRETKVNVAQHCLEFKQANLNRAMVHEIEETSSDAIMELSDGSK
jgi:hypothetical protein